MQARTISRFTKYFRINLPYKTKCGFATNVKKKELPNKDKLTIYSDYITVEFGKPFKLHRLKEGPPVIAKVTREELFKYYTEMTVARRAEVQSDNLYKSKQIRGFLHLFNGQEAVVTGMENVIPRSDHVITAYRDHAHYLGRGGTVRELFAELLGKKTGCSHGKGGSMHLYKPEANFHGGNGIVGAQIPVGTGVAFALKYRDLKNVCFTFYGDGAANQGQVFEAYNMAALWKLPCVYVCENNKFGMGTSAERAAASILYYTRGDYIPGLWVDGMNVLAVREAIKFSRQYALDHGPIILEMETYRYMGHSMSDPGLSYRTREDVNAVRTERDPIDRVKTYIIESGLGTEDELKEIDKKIRKEVEEALKQAQEDPLPDETDLFNDVYLHKPYFIRGVDVHETSKIVQ